MKLAVTQLLIGIVILYYVFGSIIPAMKKVEVSDQTKKATEKKQFTSDSKGSDRASVIINPADALNIRIETVRSAKETLDIVTYKIVESESTQAFFGEVYEAAERGVRVNIIVNGLMAVVYRNHSTLEALSAHPNITCRLYNPVQLLNPTRLQFLLHNKIILADKNYLLLGGRNIDERHFRPVGFEEPLAYDLEIFVVNTDRTLSSTSVIGEVREYIDSLYQYKWTKILDEKRNPESIQEILKTKKDYPKTNPQFYKKSIAYYIEETVPTNKITLIHNPIDAERKEPVLGHQLRYLAMKAKEKVVVQTPYMTSAKDIFKTFRTVANRVNLTILTNSSASTPNLFGFSNYYGRRKKFVQTGADIYEFQSYDSVHNKSVIIDDKISIIGTFNMDARSLYINSEVMLVVDSEEFNNFFTRDIEKFQNQSLKVGEDNEYLPDEDVEKIDISLVKKVFIWIFFHLLRGIQLLL